MLSHLSARIRLSTAVQEKTAARDQAIKASIAIEGEVVDRVGYSDKDAYAAGTDEAHLAQEIAELELIDAEIALSQWTRDRHIEQIAVYKSRIVARENAEAVEAYAQQLSVSDD